MTGKTPKRRPRPGVDKLGRTALHYAANRGSRWQCALLLLLGFKANSPDDNGWTPLHFAAQANSPGVTRSLLRAGADVRLPIELCAVYWHFLLLVWALMLALLTST